MGRGRKRGGVPHEDQFGEVGTSQDRDEHYSHGGRGGSRGGGTAGGTRGGVNLTFERHVPKFLQSYAHLLGSGQYNANADQSNPSEFEDILHPSKKQRTEDGNASDFEDEEEFALQKALTENPELAQVHPELAHVADRMKAAELKEKGNKAFSDQDFKQAVLYFSQAIPLDRDNEVYYSNRAAAYINLKQYSEAEKDCRKVISLKPSWVKGWSRLGSVLLAQGDASEAREAFEKALALEPNNTTLQIQLTKALALEEKEKATGAHKFKKHKVEERKRSAKDVPVFILNERLGEKKKQLLSFGDEEESNG